jgi:hypothetical protein
MNADFGIIWSIGNTVFKGLNPYSVPNSYYPPAASYLFVVFGIFPKWLAFIFLTTANIGVLLKFKISKKIPHPSLLWILYAPVFYALGVGQIDLLFLGLSLFLNRRDWKAIVAASLITLKPQIAFIILPWTLFQWIKTDKRYVAIWLFSIATLHLAPLFIDSHIYSDWFLSLSFAKKEYMSTAPSLFSLTSFLNIPWIVLIPVALALVITGLNSEKYVSWASQSLCLPFGYWYNLMIFTGRVPVKVLLPMSWIAFFCSYFVFHAFYPMGIIPITTYAYLLRESRLKSKELLYLPLN